MSKIVSIALVALLIIMIDLVILPFALSTEENQTINELGNETQNETIIIIENLTEPTEPKPAVPGLPKVKLEIIIPDTLLLGTTYNSLFKITNLNHTPGAENFVRVNVHYTLSVRSILSNNETLLWENYFNKTINHYSSADTGRLFIEEMGNYTLCGNIVDSNAVDNAANMTAVCKNFTVENPMDTSCFVELSLSTDKEIYDDNERVEIRNEITNSLSNKSYPFMIEYWVEDLFGNEVKKKANTTNTDDKSFTPKIEESDQVFLVKNQLLFIACNNTNAKIENSKLIVVIKKEAISEQKQSSESSISIDFVSVPESGLKFGDDFSVRLDMHKGNTSRSAMQAYVEKEGKKVSGITSFQLNRKNSDYNITIRVMLNQDCDEKLEYGDYKLVVEGLGEQAEQKIKIENRKKTGCPKEKNETVTATAATKQAKASGEIISFYTRAIKMKPIITLYANIKAEGEHQLLLTTESEEQEKIIDGDQKLEFNVTTINGSNVFLLELRKGELLVDAKALTWEGEVDEKTSLNKLLLADDGNDDNQDESANQNWNKQSNTPGEALPITGSLVYESSTARIARNAPYILVPVILLVIVGLVVSKKKITG